MSRLPNPFDEEDTEPAPIQAQIQAPAARRTYDTSRGDPAKFTGNLREFFKSEVDNAERINRENDVLDRNEARLAEAAKRVSEKAAATQAKKAANSAREADFTTRGVKHYVDAFGDVQPERNEDGTTRFSPKTGETQYDPKTGEAFRENRTETKPKVRENLDANAEYGTHPQDQGTIYKQNKHTGWTPVATLDEGLTHGNPAIKAAAQKAKDALEKEIHGAAKKAFALKTDEVSAREAEANLSYQQAQKTAADLQKRIEAIRTTPAYNETDGGVVFGFGKKPSGEAATLKAEEATLNAKIAELTANPPDPKTFEEERKQASTAGNAFDFHAGTKGVDGAAEHRRQQIAAAGENPDDDLVLKSIGDAREKAGLPRAHKTPEKVAQEKAMREHPVIGPVMQQAEALKTEHAAKVEALQQGAQASAQQLDELKAQAESATSQEEQTALARKHSAAVAAHNAQFGPDAVKAFNEEARAKQDALDMQASNAMEIAQMEQRVNWEAKQGQRKKALESIPKIAKQKSNPEAALKRLLDFGMDGKGAREALAPHLPGEAAAYKQALADAAKEIGVKPEQVDQMADDHNLLSGDLGGKAHALKFDGRVVVDPILSTDPEKWNAAIDATGASKEAKAKAKAERIAVRDAGAGAAMHAKLIDSADFNEFSVAHPGLNDGETVEAYFAAHKDDTISRPKLEAIKAAARNIMPTIAQQFYGAAAFTLGNDTEFYNGTLGEFMQDSTASSSSLAGMREGMGGAGVTGKVFDLAGSIIPSLAMSPLARGAGAIGGMASKKAGEVVARGAMGVLAGGQSVGGVYADAYDAGKKAGLSDEAARSASMLPAAASGALTSFLTTTFAGGMERLMLGIKSGNVGAGGVKTYLKQAAKEFGKEFPEEYLDELGQGIIAQMSYDPNRKWQDIFSQAFEAGLMGGFGAGAISFAGTRDERRAEWKQDIAEYGDHVDRAQKARETVFSPDMLEASGAYLPASPEAQALGTHDPQAVKAEIATADEEIDRAQVAVDAAKTDQEKAQALKTLSEEHAARMKLVGKLDENNTVERAVREVAAIGAETKESIQPELDALLAEDQAERANPFQQTVGPAAEASKQITAKRAAKIAEIQARIEAAPTAASAAHAKLAATALLKIARGRSMDSLTSAEQQILNENYADDSFPRVAQVKGGDGETHPVITDGAIERLRAVAPSAADLIASNETERRAAVKTLGATATEAAEPQAPTAPTGSAQTQTPQGPNQNPSPVVVSSPNNTPHVGIRHPLRALNVQEHKRAGDFRKILVKLGVSDTLADRVARGYVSQHPESANEAPSKHRAGILAALDAAGGKSTITESELAKRAASNKAAYDFLEGEDATSLASAKLGNETADMIHAVESLERKAGRQLTDTEVDELKKAVRIFSTAIARWRVAFKAGGIEWQDAAKGSGGAFSDIVPGNITFSIKDIINRLNLADLQADPKRAENMVREEAIHAWAQQHIAPERASKLWEEISKTARETTLNLYHGPGGWKYNTDGATVLQYDHETKVWSPSSPYAMFHEFFRYVVEGKIGADEIAGTEQTSPTLMKRIVNLLKAAKDFFTNLSAKLSAEGVSANVIAEVDGAADLCAAAMQKISDDAELSDPYLSQYVAKQQQSGNRGGVGNVDGKKPANGARKGGNPAPVQDSGSGGGSKGAADNTGATPSGDGKAAAELAEAKARAAKAEAELEEVRAKAERAKAKRNAGVDVQAGQLAELEGIRAQVPDDAKAAVDVILRQVVLGAPTYVIAKNQEHLPASYMAAPLNLPQASHHGPDQMFAANGDYIGKNTREYDKDIDEQAKIQKMTAPGAPNPDVIVSPTKTSADGPPMWALVIGEPTTTGGKPRVFLQTAGGNARTIMLQSSTDEDANRFADKWQADAAAFGFTSLPEGFHGGRFLGVHDTRTPAGAAAYAKLVDALNPSLGVEEDARKRADIDAQSITPSDLSGLSLDMSSKQASEQVDAITRAYGLDTNKMASVKNQGQFYMQRLMLGVAFRSKTLSDFYFDVDTFKTAATAKGLIKAATTTLIELRSKDADDVADAITITMGRITDYLKNGKTIAQALRLITNQDDNGLGVEGTATPASAAKTIQRIAEAMQDKVQFRAQIKNGEKPVDSEGTLEGFTELFEDITRAVGHHDDTPNMFGETDTIAQTLERALAAHARRNQEYGAEAVKSQASGEIQGDEQRSKPYSNTDERTKTTTSEGTGSSDAGRVELPEQGQLRGRDGGVVDGRGRQSEGDGLRPTDDSPKSRAVDARGRDARLVAEFGDDWPGGWNGLGLPNQPAPLRLFHPLLAGTEYKTSAILRDQSKAVRLGLLPQGRCTRMELRNAIANYFLRGGDGKKTLAELPAPQSTKSPEIMLLAGGGGAGKSSMLGKLTERGEFNETNRVLINADEVREFFPEYDHLTKLKDARASSSTHEESSIIASEIFRRAKQASVNITYDGTLANGEKWLKEIEHLQAAGWRVRMVAVTIDPHEAIVRAYLRGARNGRYVPDQLLLMAHAGFNSALPAYAELLGHEITIYDNSPRHAIKIAPDELKDGVAKEIIANRANLKSKAKTLDALLRSYGESRQSSAAEAIRSKAGIPDPNQGGFDFDAVPAAAPQGKWTPATPDNAKPGMKVRNPQDAGHDYGTVSSVSQGMSGPIVHTSKRAKNGKSKFMLRGFEVFEDAPATAPQNLFANNPVTIPAPNRKDNHANKPKTKPRPNNDAFGWDHGDLFLAGLQANTPQPGKAPSVDSGKPQTGPGLGADAAPGRPKGGGVVGAGDGVGGRGAGVLGGNLDSGSGEAEGGVSGALGTEGSGTAARIVSRPAVGSPDRNAVIDPARNYAPKQGKARFTANMDAIRLMRQLEAEKRNATTAEKETLLAYTGWGWMKEAFNKVRGERWTQKLAKIRAVWESANRTYEAAKGTHREYYAINPGPWEAYQAREMEATNYTADDRTLASWAKNYLPSYEQLRAELSNEEFDAAAKSVRNAHYTDVPVIGAMWGLVERLGFKGGKATEPGGGIGHFIGAQPEGSANRTTWNAVELDGVTARILAHLYPEANVNGADSAAGRIVDGQGFQHAKIPNSSQDLFISNVPFAKEGPAQSEKEFGKQYNLHNYFFARAFAKVKPGGLVVFITSNSTMDNNLDQRKALAAMGDLVGAIRLPNTAFKANAGTEVTTDIIVFRKPDGKTPSFTPQDWIFAREMGKTEVRVKKAEGQAALDWMKSQPSGWVPVNPEIADAFTEWRNAKHPASGIRAKALLAAMRETGEMNEMQFTAPVVANEYFAAHPEHALGTHTLQGNMYGANEYSLSPNTGTDLIAQMNAAIATFPENIAGSTNPDATGDESSRTASKTDRVGTYIERDGDIFEVGTEGLTTPDWAKTPSKAGLFREWNRLRDAYNTLIALELSNDSQDADIESARADLNRIYDGVRFRHHALAQAKRNKFAFLDTDPDYIPLQCLEVVTQDMGADGKPIFHYDKADIFTKRQIQRVEMPTTADTLEDAVLFSMTKNGFLHPPYVAELLNITEAEATARLLESKLSFINPSTGLIEVADSYLSGNVARKLDEALEAGKDDPRYRGNIEALQAVQPAWQSIAVLHPNLRAKWVPAEVIQSFAEKALGLTAVVVHRAAGATQFDGHDGGDTDSKFTGGGMDAAAILTHIIADKTITVKERVRQTDGSYKSEVNSGATSAANMARDQIEQAFDEYVKTTGDTVVIGEREISVTEATETAFNKNVGGWVPPTFNGDWITLPGQSGEIYLDRGFRKSVLARFLTQGFGMMAHGVGSGKTLTQVALVMELRRLGKAKKPVIVVEKSTIGQFASSFRRAYPQAKLLVAGENNFGPKDRAKFLGMMQAGDWDAIIMTRPQVTKIPHDESALEDYIAEKLAELDAAFAAAEDGSKAQSHIQSQRDALEEMIRKMGDKLRENSDLEGVTWEKLGVDAIVVDEAHNFKNTFVQTAKENVKNLPTGSFAQQAVSMELKTASVRNRNAGKGVFFATGTPVSNAMHEAWVMIRYIAPHILEENGVDTFDQFADTYGQVVTGPEASWSGEVKDVTRFAKFVHGQSLIAMIRSVFDVAMGNAKLGLDVPQVAGGHPELRILPQTPPMEAVNDWVVNSVAQTWTETFGEKDDNGAVITPGMPGLRDYIEANPWVTAVPIMTMQAGIAAALDPRMLHDKAEDHPGSKVNTAVREILERYHNPDLSAKKTTQVVFSDLRNSFNMDYLEQFTGANPFSDLGPNERKFDLYEDIAKKLIAGGMKPSEVGWLESGMSDEKKEAFFAKVNSGEIRVVIGGEGISTGVNIQERLGHAYHLMPPRNFKPAQMEQRNGRIIRQGNLWAEWGHNAFVAAAEKATGQKFEGKSVFKRRAAAEKHFSELPPRGAFADSPGMTRRTKAKDAADAAAKPYHVTITEFGMEKSLDSAVYSMMAAKQGFIGQILSGEAGAEFEDPTDGIQMSMAEMAAQTIGDPKLIRKIELERELKAIRTERAGWVSKRAELTTAERTLEGTLPIDRKNIVELERLGREMGDMFTKRELDDEGRPQQALYEMGDGTKFDPEAKREKDAPKDGIYASINRYMMNLWAGRKGNAQTVSGEIKINGVPIKIEVEDILGGGEQGMPGSFTFAGRVFGFRGAQSLIMKLHSITDGIGETAARLRSSVEIGEKRLAKARESLESYPAQFAKEEDFLRLTAELQRVRAAITAETQARNATRRDAANPPAATPEAVRSQAVPADDRSTQQLVTENIGLAYSLADGFSNTLGSEKDDRRSVARMALIRAARAFEPDKGAFASYAGTAIRNALRDYHAQQDGYAARNLTTLDAPLGDDSDETGRDNVRATDDVRGDVEYQDMQRAIRESIDALPEHLRVIVQGIGNSESYTEIGEKLGISKQGIGKKAQIALDRMRQHLAKSGVRETGDVIRSKAVPQDADQIFADEVQAIADGKADMRDSVALGATPQALILAGADQLPVEMPSVIVPKVTKGAHNLPLDFVKQIPKELRDPIFVLQSANDPNALVVVTSLTHDGKPVVVAIHLNKVQGHHEINRIASMYEKDSPRTIVKWMQDGLLRYINEGKGRAWLQSNGLQLPKEGTKRGNPKLRTDSEIVNGENEPAKSQAVPPGDASDEIARLHRIAMSEESGKRTIGRPDLAMGAIDPLVMAVDEWRKANANKQTHKQWEDEAEKMLATDYAGTKARIMAAGMRGDQLSSAEVKAAMQIVVREVQRAAAAPDDATLQSEVQQLTNAYREARAEQARGLAAGRDPLKTPADRYREFLAKVIYQAPPDVQKKLDDAKTPEERKKILSEDAKRIARIQKALADMGITFDDIFSGEVELQLKNRKIVENELAAAKGSDADILKAFQEKRNFAVVAAELKVSEAEVKRVVAEAAKRIRDRHFDKFKKGATMSNVVKSASAAPAIDPAEAEFAKFMDSLGLTEETPAQQKARINKGKKKPKGRPFDINDPTAVVHIARTIQGLGANGFDMVMEYWINSILSGLTTHAVNIASNALNTAAEMTVGRGMESLVNIVFRQKDAASFGEFPIILRAATPALARGWRMALDGWAANYDFTDHVLLGKPIDLAEAAGKSVSRNAIPGAFGTLVRMPGRALMFADSFFKGTIATMEVGAMAYRIAKAEGLKDGAMEARIKELVDTPGSVAWELAVEKAKEFTFQTDLKSYTENTGAFWPTRMSEGVAKWMMDGCQEIPPLRFIIPFIRTPYNILRTGFRKTPLGSIPLAWDVGAHWFARIRNGKVEGNPALPPLFVKHASEQAMAWMLMALIWDAIEGDDDDDKKQLLITGSSPKNADTTRGTRELQRRAYGGDYVIRIGGRGGITIPFGRIEPFATTLGTMTDGIRSAKRQTDGGADKLDSFLGYFVAQTKSKSFLSGLGGFMDMINESKDVLPALKKNVLSSIVPNLIRQPLRATDEYKRDWKSEDWAQTMFPTGEGAEKAHDVYGNDVKKTGNTLSRIFMPSATETPDTLPPADALLLRWNTRNPTDKFAPQQPNRTYRDKKTGKDVEMTAEQYRDFTERVGKRVTAQLAGKITPAMIENPKERDKDLIKSTFENARSKVREEMFQRKAVDLKALVW